jgi:hypothetical protein
VRCDGMFEGWGWGRATSAVDIVNYVVDEVRARVPLCTETTRIADKANKARNQMHG